MWLNILLIAVAYLLGSVPSAVWIGRRFYKVDVREHGSHNAGATNTLRVLGRRAALPVFLLDFTKGTAALALAWLAGYPNRSPQMFNLEIALVAAAVLGHMFPIFANFRGGKGVATLAGSLLAMQPLAVLICFGIFVVVFAISKYVSLSSITAGICFPFVMYFAGGVRYVPMVVFSIVIAVLIVVTHAKNIKRLINRTESRTYIFNRKSNGCGL